jgi:hypothetical protein
MTGRNSAMRSIGDNARSPGERRCQLGPPGDAGIRPEPPSGRDAGPAERPPGPAKAGRKPRRQEDRNPPTMPGGRRRQPAVTAAPGLLDDARPRASPAGPAASPCLSRSYETGGRRRGRCQRNAEGPLTAAICGDCAQYD